MHFFKRFLLIIHKQFGKKEKLIILHILLKKKKEEKRKDLTAGNITSLEVSKLIPWKNQKQFTFLLQPLPTVYILVIIKKIQSFAVFFKHFYLPNHYFKLRS